MNFDICCETLHSGINKTTELFKYASCKKMENVTPS